ncbi:cation:proton antiporter domain-containing protein [Govanella unica]|uniref:Cation:proton antiporter n=1 Tax=Govanella unica TaxID=2975056 RepID=A0A9X3Z7Z7_9PROT|nr:cation:proton antiporter [Govania unica]MDA5194790.1 cation:proton antiporter [Govania unica]
MTPADVASDALFFQDILILLVAAVVSVLALARLGASPIVGYILAGLAIGPGGLALLNDREQIAHFADVGVIFLMFTIGLELSFARLKAMRRDVFGLGFLQMTVSMAVVVLLASLVNRSIEHAIIIAGALALSSTAVVLPMLAGRGDMPTRFGRKAFAILLFQDLAVIPLILFVETSASGGPALGAALGSSMWLGGLKAVGQAVIAIAGVIAIGRLLLRPLFRAVARTRSDVVFTAAAFLILFGIASAMESVGLSMELGAFLAGLLIAETEYREVIQRDIEPYQGLLLGLFFMTVGMNLDAHYVVDHVALVVGVLVIVVVVKGAIITLLGRLFRLTLGEALRLGLSLAQVGEFAFVIMGLAARKFLDPDMAQLLYVVGGLSLAVTPALFLLGERWQKKLDRRSRETAARERLGPDLETTASRSEGHVVIAGFGRVGHTVAALLERHKLDFVALDTNPDRVADAIERGLSVFYGDGSRRDLLKSAGIAHAAAMVVTIDDPVVTAASVRAARELAPDLPIVVRAHDAGHCHVLMALGATASVPETLEASLQLGGRVLEALGTPAEVVNDSISDLRADDYAQVMTVEQEPGISPG